MRTIILAGLLASAIAMPVLAQNKPEHSSPAPAAKSTAPQSHGNVWRSSKLIGLNVYNDKNEKLGDINEIMVDKSGKIDGVVIGVGGFLGVGEHNIKVEMTKLKFIDEPTRTSSTSTTSTSGSGASNRPAATTNTTTTDHKWYPDHAILSGATKDSLKNMRQFKYD
jgi:sporulation protein YlmC with PRC-barrel domain